MCSRPKKPGRLEGVTNWSKWLEYIQKTATRLDVWEYCNPETEKKDLPDLQEPQTPDAFCMGWSHELEDLDNRQIEERIEKYKSRILKYIKDRDAYRQKCANLRKIEDLIRLTITADCMNRVFGSRPDMYGAPWDLLRKLRDSLSRPSDRDLEDLEVEWTRLRDTAENPVILSYVDRWTRLIDDLVGLRLVKDVDGEYTPDKILLDSMTEFPYLTKDSDYDLGDQPWFQWPESVNTDTEVESGEGKDDDTPDSDSHTSDSWPDITRSPTPKRPEERCPCGGCQRVGRRYGW